MSHNIPGSVCFWPLWNAKGARSRSVVTGGKGAVWHPHLVLNETEEQFHSVSCAIQIASCMLLFLFFGRVCLGFPGLKLLSSELKFLRGHTLAPLLGLAWSVTSLCSALKFCTWELHDCPVKLLCSSLNDSWVTADAGVQWNACHCRTFNATCHMLILKERSGSLRFCGSSFLHVWQTQRSQEVFLSIQCQALVVGGV